MKKKQRKKLKGYVQVPKALIDKLGRDKALVWAEVYNKTQLDSGSCYETIPKMAKETGMTVKYFRRLLKELVDDRYFNRKKRAGSSHIFTDTGLGAKETEAFNKKKSLQKGGVKNPPAPLQMPTLQGDVTTKGGRARSPVGSSTSQVREDLRSSYSNNSPKREENKNEPDTPLVDDKGSNGIFPADFNVDDHALFPGDEPTGWCHEHDQLLVNGDACKGDKIVTKIADVSTGWSTVDQG